MYLVPCEMYCPDISTNFWNFRSDWSLVRLFQNNHFWTRLDVIDKLLMVWWKKFWTSRLEVFESNVFYGSDNCLCLFLTYLRLNFIFHTSHLPLIGKYFRFPLSIISNKPDRLSCIGHRNDDHPKIAAIKSLPLDSFMQITTYRS